MREAPTFDLVVLRPGKMQQASGNNPPRRITPSGEALPNVPSGRLSTFVVGAPEPGNPVFTMYGNAVPISSLVSAIQSWAGRRVIDKTNLNGSYNVYLQFSQESATADPAGPPIFTAIQQELGLKLESSRGSAQVLVIDSIQKPSEN